MHMNTQKIARDVGHEKKTKANNCIGNKRKFLKYQEANANNRNGTQIDIYTYTSIYYYTDI